MLHLFLAVAFSAVPLTLYIPPIRSLTLFVEVMEGVWKDSSAHTVRIYPRVRHACSRIMSCMLGHTGM